MKNIAIYGAGGFGREIACMIRQINLSKPVWNFVGFFDDGMVKGCKNEYGEILGGILELNSWQSDLAIVIAIGSPEVIEKITVQISNRNIYYPNIIAPTVLFLDKESIRMGQGNIFCNNCIVSCNTTFGDFNVFNGCIPIGHDTTIGSYNVVMPSCNISGGVKIGNRNFLGVQSVILQYIAIGNNTRIGANSVIIRKTQDNNLYIGNPATKVKL